MKKLTKKQKWFKKIILTKRDKVYVGLDVHKRSISVAIWVNGQVEITFNTPADYPRLIERLKLLKKALKMVVYEAGPTGYGLARSLQKADLPVQVISPSNTPRPSKRLSKTDRLDCCQLAEFAAKDLLHPVTIPSEQEEADRQLVRWTKTAVSELQLLCLNSALRFTLDMYLKELEELSNRIKRTEMELQVLSEEPRHKQAMEILRSHPGVGPVTAWSYRLEIYQPKRFRKATAISSFLGLAPRIIQSGETCREGPISKTGREQLRSKLIEASWVWIRYDEKARKVYNRLCMNTGNNNKAIVVRLAYRCSIRKNM